MSSTEHQWISTASMNRFYDHCYLIECAYHIISRYCCSFTNLLTHDDGSIPYYLVQKVKIAVEYGKILLNSRYRPFQHQLRIFGVYDYIDQPQYQKLCTLWNTIKAETQIVEMYFNQISLLIYPVVSSTTLPFLESVDNEGVSALIKINAIIHTLINYNETTSTATLKKNMSRLLKSDTAVTTSTTSTSTAYLNEEEFGIFIVNNIIEPLFEDEESNSSHAKATTTSVSPKKKDYFFKGVEDAFTAAADISPSSLDNHEKRTLGQPPAQTTPSRGGVGEAATKKLLRCMSPEISDFMFERGTDQLQAPKSNWLANDLCSIFKMEDQLLLGNIFLNSRIKSFAGNDKNVKCHDGRSIGNDTIKKYNRNNDNFRSIRYDNQKRFNSQRKYPKRNYDKTCANGNYEYVNKKFGSDLTMTPPTMPSSLSANGLNKNFI